MSYLDDLPDPDAPDRLPWWVGLTWLASAAFVVAVWWVALRMTGGQQ